MASIGYLGPPGTFHEQALLGQPDLAAHELVALSSIPEVLAAVTDTVDLGFVAIENSIDGTVTVTLDTLAFETGLLIQREVVLNIELHLLAKQETAMADVRRVLSFPTATAQVRGFLGRELPGAAWEAANSTSEAAALVAASADVDVAAVAPPHAGELHGLSVLAADIADHPHNQTRFVLVATSGVPEPTGHDKTTVVCFQRHDRPGSLLAILQEFAARGINLVKLESRPTKRGLGDYCFTIDLEGHVADEVVADCLRTLRAKLADVKFLGSYPAAGHQASTVRRDADAAWRKADDWLRAIRTGSPSPA